MTKPTFSDETQFLGWGDGPQGPWIKLKLPDSDDLGPFRGMTAAKATMAGQRLACVLVEIGDDEQPKAEAVIPASEEKQWDKPKGGPLAQLAGQWCNVNVFLTFLEERGSYPMTCEKAAEYIRSYCGVKSRAEIDSNPDAKAKFLRLRADYMNWSGV